MNIVLPANSTHEDAAWWLRQLVQDVGLGFHLDTPPEDYRLPSGGDLFTSSECAAMSASLERLFVILGDESPYEICARESSVMLAERLGLKPPLEFNDPDVQHELFESGNVDELSMWLCWNGANSSCGDREVYLEELRMQPLETLREMMLDQISP